MFLSVSFAILAHIIIERLFFVLQYKNVCLIIDCCDSRGTFILYRAILSYVFDFLIRIGSSRRRLLSLLRVNLFFSD